MVNQADVVVVGAGLSGIMAGRILVERGKSVILLDKGRSVGGRCATRRIGAGTADTGAQFFTGRDPEFQQYIESWIADGLVFEWSRGWSDGSIVDTRDGHPRYAVKGGMNALPKFLAKGLDVHVNTEVQRLNRTSDGWMIEDKNDNKIRARALLLTPPVPQSLQLITNSNIELSNSDQHALEGLTYAPCITALIHVDGSIALPDPGAMQRPHANLYWIADNQAKGISDTKILTLQANHLYSQQLFDLTDEEILKKLHVDLEPLMGSHWNIIEAQIKRWRYSQPVRVYEQRCLVTEITLPSGSTAPLVFAGDAFGGPRVEGAFRSGLAAGRALAEMI